MFERYTESARRTIFFARHEATHRGVEEIQLLDLVLGIATEAQQPDATNAALRGRWDELLLAFGLTRDRGPCPADRDLRLSEQSKKALAYAAMEAERDHSYAIEPEHLLRGVLRTEDKGIISGLQTMDVTLESVRDMTTRNQVLTDEVQASFTREFRKRRKWFLLALLCLGVVAVLFLHFQGD